MARWAASLALAVTVAACVTAPTGDSTVDPTVPAGEASPALLSEGPLRTVSTSGDSTGNRYHEGAGSLPGEPLELAGHGPVAWVLAAETDGRILVVAVDEEGAVAAHSIEGDVVEPIRMNLTTLPVTAPPAMVVNEGALLLGPPVGTGSLLTSPLALSSGGLAFVTDDRAVVVTQTSGNRRFEIDPLPDGRLTMSSEGVLAVLTQPTDRYPHGIAGDPIEAAAVDLIDMVTLDVVSIVVPDGRVVEGISGMWVDLDDDGRQEVVLTLSDAEGGARLAVLSAEGKFVADSGPIGLGNRWRHQIAVAPFGPNGETELADVRTPHIGGTVEFFAWSDEQLQRTASLEGYSSHTIGSRNLDQTLAADADGDGRPEVVVPHRSMASLAGVQRSEAGAEEVWAYDLGAELTSNLTGVTMPDGRFVLVAGLSDGRVLVWQ